MTSTNDDPMSTIERLVAATNAHYLEGIVACFAAGYTLEAPLHPARSFRGIVRFLVIDERHHLFQHGLLLGARTAWK